MQQWSIKEINRYCAERPLEIKPWINQVVAKYILAGWSSVVICSCLVLSTLLNYLKYADSLLLFSFLPTVLLFIAFPILLTFVPKTDRITDWYVTTISLSFMLGLVHVMSIIEGTGQPIRNYPIQLAVGVPTLFSFHRTTTANSLVTAGITLLCALLIYNVNNDLFMSSQIQFVQGYLIGTGLNLFLMQSLKVWFVSQSLNTSSMIHAFDQLKKIVFPHQIDRIKAGESLEDTMPCGLGKGCVIVFDIQGSSQIKHPLVKEMLSGVLRACEEIIFENYTSQPLAANGYRIKEMGDGFVCSIGFPFKQPDSQNMFDLAVRLAHRFQETIDLKLKEFNYNAPIFSGAGIAYGELEGFFPSSGVKQYDLYGRAIILATRYESLRRSLFEKNPDLSGHVIILNEVVWHGLSADMQKHFQPWDLRADDITVRDDPEASKAFFHISSTTATDTQKAS